jgi:apolipoprotein D and lipocalin family protein
VVNKGYNPDRGMWQKTDGVAYFTGQPSRAALKVSFFGPFYGGYNVIALDKDYRYALVCGQTAIISGYWRARRNRPEVKQQMLDIATRQGFDVSKLIWVNQRY